MRELSEVEILSLTAVLKMETGGLAIQRAVDSIITDEDLKKQSMSGLIASSMLSSAKEATDVYLNATLTSSTPELRSIYSASLGQIVAGHTALTELSVHKRWINPYNAPTQQLSDSYNESKNVINQEK